MADIHKKGAEDYNQAIPKLSINSHGFVGESYERALEIAFPAFKVQMDKIGKERGWSPMTKQQFEASLTIEGANVVGNPQQVIDKIMYQYEIFKHDRFLLQMSVGSIEHKELLKSIELFATEVAPVIRNETKKTDSVVG